MCYEFSEWSWKMRSAERVRKQREAQKTAPTEREAPLPAKPTTPEPRVEEQEKVPA
jgi:hypothetical protein